MTDPVLTPADVATLLKITESNVRALVRHTNPRDRAAASAPSSREAGDASTARQVSSGPIPNSDCERDHG